MMTRATSIPNNSFRRYRQCPEKGPVRPRPTASPHFASPQDPQACLRAIGGPPSAFPGSLKSLPGPHRG